MKTNNLSTSTGMLTLEFSNLTSTINQPKTTSKRKISNVSIPKILITYKASEINKHSQKESNQTKFIYIKPKR
ncbi:hypothetical protein HNP25_003277 [Arcicella rosea]|uniref:Uncharacterized protein n=1 Tax=Arcicella rosea TaxID=502909 RepID=A0A841EYP2_9BACT|nr:hypothetical protein [Arcicella rosea]